jgi:hypothetical protein
VRIAVVTICLAWLAATAHAAPPEPTGPHPRMLLDGSLRATWKAQRKAGAIAAAIDLCEDAGNTREHGGAQYMGSEWKKVLQACLVAWVATDEARHAAAAIRYFTALLDDLDALGDGKGGDAAANRDSGYAIRNLGPYTAIAYDWLHDAPGMTAELRARARQRWAAWLAWYERGGYHAHDPGSNYQAGYLLAATTIAIAQAGEAGEPGRELWRLVADRMWNKDMAAAWSAGSVLDGGDWDEGWQYGPLAVASYALAARIARPHGLRVDGVADWLGAMLRRHVYALNPGDRLWVGGDFDSEDAYIKPAALTLDAIALGDARPEDRRWARGELARLKLTERDSALFEALAVGDAAAIPRAGWPLWYRAAGTATLFSRTGWDDRAIWFVAACARTAGLDHRGPNAGNFVLSRGPADLIVDPSPYGSLSTLTGNAPTVRSKLLPDGYQPSQGAWGGKVHWRWATQTEGGVVAARCDYSDAFRFQDTASDIADALRDFVLLPSADGRDASLVIVDRATTGDAARKMYLRFRVPAALALEASPAVPRPSPGPGGPGVAIGATGAPGVTAVVKGARVTIRAAAGPAGHVERTRLKDCFQPGTTRGGCDAARLPVADYRVEIAGPDARAVHVITATDARGNATSSPISPISGDRWTGVAIAGTRDAVVVWPTRPGALTYRAPRRAAVSHVVLDAPAAGGKAQLTARPDGDACVVTVEPGGTTPAAPLIATLDQRCTVTADPEASTTTPPPHPPMPPPARASITTHSPSGCCSTGAAPATPLALALVVLARARRKRHRSTACA